MSGQADDGERQAVGLERHAQTIFSAVAIALLLWVGKTVSDVSASVAVLQSKFEGLENMRDSLDATRDQVADLRSRTSNLEFRTGEVERAVNRAQQGQRP